MKQAIQSALNRYLALDPESNARLHALNNTFVTVELQGIPFIFQLQFMDARIHIVTDDFNPPNTTIKGKPISLLHMSFTKENRKRFFEEGVVIEGDINLGMQVIRLFDELEIDWEEHVSAYIGDIPAHEINRVFQRIKQFGKRLNDSFIQSTNEYIHEEKPIFPAREALNDFFQDIDTLRMDTDRLEARIDLLNKRIAAKRSS